MSARPDVSILAPGTVAMLRPNGEQTAATPDGSLDMVEDLLALLDEQLPGVAGSFLRGRLLELRARIAGMGGDRTAADSNLRLVPFVERPVTRVRSAQLATSQPPLRFELLGRFGVCRGSWRAGESDWGRPVDARLLRVLLIRLDQPVPEDAIFEALWPDLAVPSARRSLHVAVSRLRGLLDCRGADGTVIESRDRAYRLALGERDIVDAEEFRAASDNALDERGEQRRVALERARALWSGEPLPEERYSDWATAYRERLADRYIAVLAALVELHEQDRDHAHAVDASRELVALDPLNEGGHRALITAYARIGRRGRALRQFLECRRALVEQLGVEPAEETTRLQARILAGEAI